MMGVLKAEVLAEKIKSLFSHRITYLLEKAAVWIFFCVDIYTCLCSCNNKRGALLCSSIYLCISVLFFKLVNCAGKRLHWIRWKWFSSKLVGICKICPMCKKVDITKIDLVLVLFLKHTRSLNLKHSVIKYTNLICSHIVMYSEVNWLHPHNVFAMAVDTKTVFF